MLFKLLSYCPDIGKIYLLIRNKKSQSAEERFARIKDQYFFKAMKGEGHRECHQLNKVCLIRGDTMEIGKYLFESSTLIENLLNLIHPIFIRPRHG